MPQPFFRFKQFTVRQDRCALKVGTDGVLLGAWTDYGGETQILDIGTGTGLLALIAAQRAPEASITALELDADAAAQAADNAAAGPWPQRITVHHADARQWQGHQQFGLIICNPPFYRGHGHPRDLRLAAAKHETTLDLPELFGAMQRLGTPGLRASLVVPFHRVQSVLLAAGEIGLRPARMCAVHFVEHKPPKRALLELRRNWQGDAVEEALCVHRTDGSFCPRYRALLHDLELHF